MGFLDSIIQPALNLVAQVPIVGAPAAGAIQQATNVVGVTTALAPTTGAGSGPIGGALDLINAPLDVLTGVLGGLGGGGQVDMTGFGGGNGRFATRTVVETMDLTTGQIIRRKVMEGSPHLMNKDVSAAKKLFRQVRKLDSRMPRKTVRESKTKQLTDAAMDKALRDVNRGCPPQS